MNLLFEVPQPSLSVTGSEQQFPVNRVFCVGRNYEAHAREMGASEREAPFFFSKPACSVLFSDNEIPYPPRTSDLHHEVELVVALDKGGRNLSERQAEEAIFAYGVGIDFTRRDLQAEAKSKGRPWDTAKGFEHSAPVSELTPVRETGLLTQGEITLSVNGQPRQQGNLGDMIWSVNEIIVELSHYFELMPGDIIFTGTPAGVSAIKPGDHLLAEAVCLPSLSLLIIGPE